MVFSSPTFLFGFLPLVLLIYYICPPKLKNISLLLFSLLFYAWGEVFYIIVLLVSIIINYFIGRSIFRNHKKTASKKSYLIAGIVINLTILISFKYLNFIADNINIVLSHLHLPTIYLYPVHLPLGISFFTFQALSYIIDVYRDKSLYQKNILNLSLYIAFFPQLIAGPIVRYSDISKQIIKRNHSLDLFASGTQRFIYGMAKKVLIANPLGEVADSVFILSGTNLTMPLAWIGIIAYTLQIFFDFSGYSDMAIGLGRIFGFKFKENFNSPYISTSVQEFWRRWHISLSNWFRDYLYIPLGGNKVSSGRVYINLFIVFILTGVWHGASWNFITWGLFHWVFLAAERAGLSIILKKMWKPFQHIYLLCVVIAGWVFFRAENLSHAVAYLKSMVDFTDFETTALQYAQVLSNESFFSFFFGLLISMPIYSFFYRNLHSLSGQSPSKKIILVGTPKIATILIILFLSSIKISASTYNPFIYFRF